jgi:hypothetical protein
MDVKEIQRLYSVATGNAIYREHNLLFEEMENNYSDNEILAAIKASGIGKARNPRYTLSVLKRVKSEEQVKNQVVKSDFRTREITIDEDHIKKKRMYGSTYDLPRHLEGDLRLKIGIV